MGHRTSEGFADALTTTTRVRFPWRDRLRILLGRPLTVRTRTATEHELGRTAQPCVEVSLEGTGATLDTRARSLAATRRTARETDGDRRSGKDPS